LSGEGGFNIFSTQSGRSIQIPGEISILFSVTNSFWSKFFRTVAILQHRFLLQATPSVGNGSPQRVIERRE
jgi:hypothetical protein